MKAQKGDPEFVILKSQAWMKASSYEDKILGTIVKQPLSPSTNYVPDSAAGYLVDSVQDGSATDFSLESAGGKTNEFIASLTSIGKVNVSGNEEDSLHLAGKFVRYKRISQLDKFWEKLKVDANVVATAPKWVKKRGTWPVCLVVGIMICEDVEYCTDSEQASRREANGEIPVSHIVLATTGVNPSSAADPKASAVSSKHTSTAFKAKMGESSIFAVELKRITTPWFSQNLVLKDDGPKVDRTRLAGLNQNGEELKDRHVIADDLVLEDLGRDVIRDMTE